MDHIQHILQTFAPITLEEMDSVQLMNRTDTKFILSRRTLEEILTKLKEHYRVLEINGRRQSRYETLYYDTPGFHHYLTHQNGKKTRWKIRKRKYVESNLSFLEIKFKNNGGRTIKSRIKLEQFDESLNERCRRFIDSKNLQSAFLEPKLINTFRRITLVNKSIPERVTIDIDVAFSHDSQHAALSHLVIAEVKQENVNRHSVFMQMVKQRIIRPEGISKYCLGVALLYPQIKSNTFKEKILKINKLEKSYV